MAAEGQAETSVMGGVVTQVISVAEFRKLAKKRPKYGNKKIELDGYKFDSLKEGRRYQELSLMLKAGDIWDLRIHPRYEFRINGVFVGSYKPDFTYRRRQSFEVIAEDVKSVATRTDGYNLRRLLLKALHSIEVLET